MRSVSLSLSQSGLRTVTAYNYNDRLQHAAGASICAFNSHNTIKIQRTPIWLLLKRASKLSFGVDYIKLNLEHICNLRSDVEEIRFELCERLYHHVGHMSVSKLTKVKLQGPLKPPPSPSHKGL